MSPYTPTDVTATRTWTVVHVRGRIYGVSAVTEFGESGRTPLTCTQDNGCR